MALKAKWDFPTEEMTSLSKTEDFVRKPLTATVDRKGRVLLPVELRARLGIKEGDPLFINEEGDTFRVAKAINPFDVLAQQALREREAGRTKNLRDRWGAEIDEDDDAEE